MSSDSWHSVEYNHVRLILGGTDDNTSVQGRHVNRRTVSYSIFSSPEACSGLVLGVSVYEVSFK